MPLCSIIMPVYKAEATIALAIESVLAQTLPDWELIVVDDGSPDSCGSICDSYAQKDSRIQVLHQSNAGVSAARNTAITKACGQWLFFLDADDQLSPIELELALQVQNEHPHDLVYWDHCKSKDNLCAQIPDLLDCRETGFENFGTLWAKDYTIGYTTNKLFSLKLVKSCHALFPQDMLYMEDTHFAIQYYRALLKEYSSARIWHIPLALYYYSLNTNSITHSHGQLYAQRQFKGVPAVISAARDFGCDASELNIIYNHYLCCVAHSLGLIKSRSVLRDFSHHPQVKEIIYYFKSNHLYNPMLLPFLLHSPALIRLWERIREKKPSIYYGYLDWGLYHLFYRNWTHL